MGHHGAAVAEAAGTESSRPMKLIVYARVQWRAAVAAVIGSNLLWRWWLAGW